MPTHTLALSLLLAAGLASAQTPKKAPPKAAPPVHSEAASSLNVTTGSDGEQIVEIRNIRYDVTGTNIPGRPGDERLLLRSTTRSKEVLGDIGMESAITLEAWPVGQDPRQKPLYSLNVAGADGRLVDNALLLVLRGLEEVAWWSAYKLGTGQHLFDTYVPLVSFSITQEVLTTRYAGLDRVGDDAKDPRLKAGNAVTVVTYASEDKVVREALVTCDEPRKAAMLRSFADSTQTLSLLEDSAQPTRTLRLYLNVNYPSPSNLGGTPHPGSQRRSGSGPRGAAEGHARQRF